MSTHGPSGEFGIYAKDRVDYITPGTDSDCPTVYGPHQGYPNPLAYWPDVATPPGGMAFWNGSLYVLISNGDGRSGRIGGDRVILKIEKK